MPYSAGGGTDYAARLLAAYWPDITGGTMVVKNRVGASGLVGTNFAYAAKPDGLTISLEDSGPYLNRPLFKQPGVQYDPLKFEYIGWFAREPMFFSISSKLPYNSMDEFQKAEGLRIGGFGMSGRITLSGALAIELFQLKNARLVTAYPGAADVGLALGRGEVDGHVIHTSGTLSNLNKGFTKPPFFVMDRERAGAFKDVPTVTEILKLTPEQDGLLRAYLALQGGKIFYAPPGTPADRVQFMSEAFAKITADPGFLAQAKLSWPDWTPVLNGKETAAVVKESVATPGEFLTQLSGLAQKYAR